MWIVKAFDEPTIDPPKKPSCRTCVFFQNQRGGKRRRCERLERRVRQNYCCDGWTWDEYGNWKYEVTYFEPIGESLIDTLKKQTEEGDTH